ncbi:inovirus-type Gp2 protein [Xanthomonas sp. NCPPB 1128]|uniref:inovirus-type Gp2 protein n=1 Tax=Xanthomonas sp. NCPPB 1128 TaxID=1775876 RepID=UPI00065AE277|nr:inovirus-type Gp2 protein [Xanthomonas sp. NCPPB 1128]
MPSINKSNSASISSQSLDTKMTFILKKEVEHEYMSDSGLLQLPSPADKADLFKERELNILMKNFTKVFKCVVESDTAALTSTRRRAVHCPAAYTLTKVGRNVRAGCIQFLKQGDEHPDWLLDYADHKFNPLITVMLHAMKRWASAVVHVPNDSVFELIDNRDKTTMTAINRLLAFIRRVGKSRKFKNAWHDYIRQADSNFRSGSRFISKLFSHHTRMLVLRVDLYLRPGTYFPGFENEAEAYAVKFRRKLRDGGIVPGYLGAISKRENGVHRGMHWHWMVFLDGHCHQHTSYYSQAIGEAWVELVGNNRASYFNCYSRRHEYAFNGLGVVNIDDIEKLLGVRAALHYMTKRGCVLQASGRKQQDFRRSKPRQRTRRGAPRKGPNDLQHVQRALGGARSRYPAWLKR